MPTKQLKSKSLILESNQYQNELSSQSLSYLTQNSGFKIKHSSMTDTGGNYVSTHLTAPNLIIGSNKYPTISFRDNQNIELNGDLIIDGRVGATDMDLMGDLTASRIDLIDSIVTPVICVTESLNSDGLTNLSDTYVQGVVEIDGILGANDIHCNTIQTSNIHSIGNLELSADIFSTIRIPNCQYRVDMSYSTIITLEAIKHNKIFVLNRSTLIESDPSCDGIEVILFNNSNIPITIKENRKILTEIDSHKSQKLLYLACINGWSLQ